MNRDCQSIVLQFHEHFPKDRIHAELLSLRYPWILAHYISHFWRETEIDDDGNTIIAKSVFDGLDHRLQWPRTPQTAWKPYTT